MTAPEAAVAGAGPAGLSAALGLRRRGFSVSVYEQAQEIQNRVCGAFLSPEAETHLRWLGLYGDVQRDIAEVREAEVSVLSARRIFPLGNDRAKGFAMPRPALEQILVRRCLDEGVQILWGHRVLAMEPRSDGAWRLEIRDSKAGRNFTSEPALAMAADGRFSTLRGGNTSFVQKASGWMGFNAAFAGALSAPGSLSLHLFTGGYVGLLTFADRSLNVCGLISEEFYKASGPDWDGVFHACLSASVPLEAKVHGARQVSAWKGLGALPYGRHLEEESGLFLAGDSAGVCDPMMGEGISRALASGPLIYQALALGDFSPAGLEKVLESYVRLWNQRYRRRVLFGRPLRWLNRRSWALRAAEKILLGMPPLRRRFLADIHNPTSIVS